MVFFSYLFWLLNLIIGGENMNNQITELTKLEDFKNVYRVFSGPPYNENIQKKS